MQSAGVDRGAGRPRILVCGWAGAGNVGDELLTEWVVQTVEGAGGTAVVSSRDPADTKARHPSVDVCRWGPRDLRMVGAVDGVIVGPGGIIQDSSSVWSLPGHLAKALIARSRRLPVAGVGIGAEPLRRRSSRWMLRRALGDALAVVTRDEPSAAAVRSAGVGAETGVDVVFGLAVPAAARGDDLVVAIGPAVRSGRLTAASSRLTDDDPGPAAAALASLGERLGARIVLTAFRGERDRRFVVVLAGVLGERAVVAPGHPDALREVVAGARAVVSSRYHAAVLAVASGVPVLVRSSQTKLLDLVAQVGDDRRASVAPDWDSVAGWTPAPVGEGVVPGSVEVAGEAVAAIVRAAAERVRHRRSEGG